MNCYDCIHCEACSDVGDSGFSALKEDVSKCKHFKNKADYVEVKRGEWLMCLTDEPWRKGYHGRCSECGALYTYNINKMPRRCDGCDALMDGKRSDT